MVGCQNEDIAGCQHPKCVISIPSQEDSVTQPQGSVLLTDLSLERAVANSKKTYVWVSIDYLACGPEKVVVPLLRSEVSNCPYDEFVFTHAKFLPHLLPCVRVVAGAGARKPVTENFYASAIAAGYRGADRF
jgi:hypothetical protein